MNHISCRSNVSWIMWLKLSYERQWFWFLPSQYWFWRILNLEFYKAMEPTILLLLFFSISVLTLNGACRANPILILTFSISQILHKCALSLLSLKHTFVTTFFFNSTILIRLPVFFHFYIFRIHNYWELQKNSIFLRLFLNV